MQQVTVDRMVLWAEHAFEGHEWVQKDQVTAAAARDGLPLDARHALRELPQARWRRETLLDLIRHIHEPQERPRMDGPIDGVPGGGHEGESEGPE
jgi:hypothetical protein